MSALLVIAGLLLLLVLTGVVYQAIGCRLDERRFAPPGRIIGAGGTRIHVQQAGLGSPWVVLEAGIAASSLSWTPVHRQIAQFTSVLSYDRPGLAWSESPRGPRTLAAIVDELRALLEAAGADPKQILVGHSFGGLVASGYASRYPEDVAGVVLVDPLAPAEWAAPGERDLAMLRRGVRLSRRGAWLARLGVVRFALAMLVAGGRNVPKAISRLSSGRGASVTQRLVGEVRKLPEEVWPMVRAHWCRPRCFLAMAGYLESLPACSEAATAAVVPPHIPVTVLSAADAPDARIEQHRAIAQRSSRGRHIIADRSGHWIHLDEPELVVSAVQEMVEHSGSARTL